MVPLCKVNEDAVIKFLHENIINRFGVPISLVFYNASYFSSINIIEIGCEKGIKLHYSANYYPHGNGLAESTNNNLIQILKKTVIESQRNWHISLPNALWEDRVTLNNSLGVSPYTLVYEKEAILPPNILLPSLQLAQASRRFGNEILQAQINTLLKLEESRQESKHIFNQHQGIVKIWFDKRKSGKGSFEVGDLVLKWDYPHDEKGKHTKFQHLWVGPY